MMKFHLQH